MQPTAAHAPRAWPALPAATARAELRADLVAGLSADEVARRRALHGPNALTAGRRRTGRHILFAQFRDFMIVVLLAAAVIAALLGEPQNSVVVLVIVVLNATIGAAQEYRAERALDALRRLAAPAAHVLRDGRWQDLPAEQLVPGDVVTLEAGQVVPADLRLLESADLRLDESLLTGESQSVEKDAGASLQPDAPLADRRTMAWRGTAVASGRGRGLAVATGMATELGRIAGMLESAEVVSTPLQRRLHRFGRQLAYGVLGACALVFALGLLRGEPPLLMFLTAVSLAVAAIPEALPAVVTVSLALGARRMSLQRTLVRRLPAVETLGSVSTICADKTGTLTENRMSVGALALASGELASELPRAAAEGSAWELLVRICVLTNDATSDASAGAKDDATSGAEASAKADATNGEPQGEPTEVALLRAAERAGYFQSALVKRHPRLGELAFDGSRRRMSTLHAEGDAVRLLMKGAPEAVVPRCTGLVGSSEGPFDAEAALAIAAQLAGQGHRVLAFATRMLPPRAVSELLRDDPERELQLIGFAGLLDPLRAGAAEAVAECRAAGIRAVMITGDHPGTALAMARRLGLAQDEHELLTGQALEALDEGALREAVIRSRVYARVTPEQKLQLVMLLQAGGEFVAMTGDGVNDAPALKRAEIGVAMGRGGTEVAREAADMVLLDDDFSTLVGAVREGRRIYDNLRKFVRYALTGNSAEIWTLLAAPLVGLPLPLLPIHILWVNLITDGLPGLALAAEPGERGLMARPPRPPSEGFFARGLWQHVVWVGLLLAALTLGAQAWALDAAPDRWRSMVFTVLTLGQLVHVMVIRSEQRSLVAQGFTSNRPLLLAVLFSVGLQLAALYWAPLQRLLHTAPLRLGELLACFGLAAVVGVAVEVEKAVLGRWRRAGTGASAVAHGPPGRKHVPGTDALAGHGERA